MNKLHTYLLPIAVGSFGLLLTPIGENQAISYCIIAFAVIVGIVGLHSLVKQQELAQASQQEMLKVLEKVLKDSNEEVANKLQKQIETIDAGTGSIVEEIKQIPIAIVGQIGNTESKLIEHILEEHEKMKTVITSLDDKVDEGNKILENVSVLTIQELRSIVQLTGEIVAVQNTMPNEISMLQSEISRNQIDVLESSRNIEVHLEKLADLQEIVQTHLETSSITHEQVVSKISEEFTAISTNMNYSASTILEQLFDYNNKVQSQLNIASTMLESLEQQQGELNKLNEQSTTTVNAQLKELRSLNKSLVAGISQIADSKSAEREQLLKIQKDLIKKYSS